MTPHATRRAAHRAVTHRHLLVAVALLAGAAAACTKDATPDGGTGRDGSADAVADAVAWRDGRAKAVQGRVCKKTPDCQAVYRYAFCFEGRCRTSCRNDAGAIYVCGSVYDGTGTCCAASERCCPLGFERSRCVPRALPCPPRGD